MSCCKDAPDVSEEDAVWRDPMDYNMQTHGPPYMPLTASQREEARQFVRKQAAYYDVPQTTSPHAPLAFLLAFLRALYMVHQTAHWQTRGGHYYGDHLLFQRIYEESLPGIDEVAERLIGLTGDVSQVSLLIQVGTIQAILQATCPPQLTLSAEDLVKVSLQGEATLLKVIDEVKQRVDSAGGLTEGLDDLLQGIASKHEEFVYLLKQRASTRLAKRYTYNRG